MSLAFRPQKNQKMLIWVKTHKPWIQSGFILGSFALLATGLTLRSSHPLKPTSSQVEALRTQISADLRRSEQTLQQIQMEADWTRSGYTPHDLFSSIAALNSPSANQLLCGVLKSASEAWILAAESEIKGFPRDFACRQLLENKLQNAQNKAHAEWESQRAQAIALENRRRFAQSKTKSTRSLTKSRQHQPGGQLLANELALVFQVTSHPELRRRLTRTRSALKASSVKAHFAFSPEAAIQAENQIQELIKEGHTIALLELSEKQLRSGAPSLSVKPEKERREFQNQFLGKLSLQNMGIIPFLVPEATASKKLNQLEAALPPLSTNVDLKDWKGTPASVFRHFREAIRVGSSREGLILRLRLTQWSTQETLSTLLRFIRDSDVTLAHFPNPSATQPTPSLSPTKRLHLAQLKMPSRPSLQRQGARVKLRVPKLVAHAPLQSVRNSQ